MLTVVGPSPSHIHPTPRSEAVADPSPLAESGTDLLEYKVWENLQHQTVLELGQPKSEKWPLGCRVEYLAHESNDRHMFQPNLMCGNNMLKTKLFFCDKIPTHGPEASYDYHPQYFSSSTDPNYYFDFRVEASQRLGPCAPLYSTEQWEEYFTVVTRYPRTSCLSATDIDWTNQSLIALHASAALSGKKTLYAFLKLYSEPTSESTTGKLRVVIDSIIQTDICTVRWHVEEDPYGELDPILLVLVPHTEGKIVSKFGGLTNVTCQK